MRNHLMAIVSALAILGSLGTAGQEEMGRFTPRLRGAVPRGAVTRSIEEKLSEFISVRDFGARADAMDREDASVSAGQVRLRCPSAAFTAGDQGKVISVSGAAGPNRPLISTIARVVGSGEVDMADAARVTVDHANVAWGSDDTRAFQIALDNQKNVGAVHVPAGRYLISSIVIPASTTLWGMSPRFVTLIGIGGAPAMVTDDGNATGVGLSGMTVEGGEKGYDALIRIGYKLPFGTEGLITNVKARDNAGTCIAIRANVAILQNNYTINCGESLRLDGEANLVDNFSAVRSYKYGIHVTGVGNVFRYTEIEAPMQGSIPIFAERGPNTFYTPIISLPANTTIPDLIVIAQATGPVSVHDAFVGTKPGSAWQWLVRDGSQNAITPAQYTAGATTFVALGSTVRIR